MLFGASFLPHYTICAFRKSYYHSFSVFSLCGRKKLRQEVRNKIKDIRLIRNRIAHHEPVFTRNLRKDLQGMRFCVQSCPAPHTASGSGERHRHDSCDRLFLGQQGNVDVGKHTSKPCRLLEDRKVVQPPSQSIRLFGIFFSRSAQSFCWC